MTDSSVHLSGLLVSSPGSGCRRWLKSFLRTKEFLCDAAWVGRLFVCIFKHTRFLLFSIFSHLSFAYTLMPGYLFCQPAFAYPPGAQLADRRRRKPSGSENAKGKLSGTRTFTCVWEWPRSVSSCCDDTYRLPGGRCSITITLLKMEIKHGGEKEERCVISLANSWICITQEESKYSLCVTMSEPTAWVWCHNLGSIQVFSQTAGRQLQSATKQNRKWQEERKWPVMSFSPPVFSWKSRASSVCKGASVSNRRLKSLPAAESWETSS